MREEVDLEGRGWRIWKRSLAQNFYFREDTDEKSKREDEGVRIFQNFAKISR